MSLLQELLLRVVQNKENISARRSFYLEYAEIDLYVYTCTYVYTISCNIHDIIVYSVCIYIETCIMAFVSNRLYTYFHVKRENGGRFCARGGKFDRHLSAPCFHIHRTFH